MSTNMLINMLSKQPGGSWDITNATYNGEYGSIEPSAGNGLAFKPDGTKLYTTYPAKNGQNASIWEFDLSEAWDVTSISYNSSSVDISGQVEFPRGLAFKPDGTAVYVITDNGDSIHQYTLSSAWDISTTTYDSKTIDISLIDSAPWGISINPSGDRVFFSGLSADTIYQLNLQTPWDISTAIQASGSYYNGSELGQARTLYVRPDGFKMFLSGNFPDIVTQYTLSGSWDIGSATYDNVSTSVPSDFSFIPGYGLYFNEETGKRMFSTDAGLTPSGSVIVWQFDL